MYDLVTILSIILPLIAIALILFLILINCVTKIRRKFPATVNCWFCNSWIKVAYDKKDSFDCPNCLQYNGFTEDGDYNKVIPEQHDEMFNYQTAIKKQKETVSNGLCTLCNNNQQLKIYQLAHFVPMVEENYDAEIEHFQTQLEKAYKLCKACDKVLKKTIDKQNAFLFGKRLKELANNGFSSLNLNRIRGRARQRALIQLGKLFNKLLLFSLALSSLGFCLIHNRVIYKEITNRLPKSHLGLFNSIVNMTRFIVIPSYRPYWVAPLKLDAITAISGLGLLLQILQLLFATTNLTLGVNRSLCWLINLLTVYLSYNRTYAAFLLCLQIISNSYLLYSVFVRDEQGPITVRPKSKSMRKLVKSLDQTVSDTSLEGEQYEEEDSVEITEIFNSSNKSTSSSTASRTGSPLINTANLKTINSDLNQSLNNLSLGTLNTYGFKAPSRASSLQSLKRPKPVLSPAKFILNNSVINNPWTAGGFWKTTNDLLHNRNLSRSSSESSGFESQTNDYNTFNYNTVYSVNSTQKCNSFCGEFERNSVISEPIFNNNYNKFNQKNNYHSLYPSLNQGMFLIQRTNNNSNNNNNNNNKTGFSNNGPILLPSNGFVFGTTSNMPYQRGTLFRNWTDKINTMHTENFKDLSLQSDNNHHTFTQN